MDLDSARFLTEILTVAGTALAAFVSVRIALNGLKIQIQLARCDVAELKQSMKEASAQRANLDTRLTVVERSIDNISGIVTRMEKR